MPIELIRLSSVDDEELAELFAASYAIEREAVNMTRFRIGLLREASVVATDGGTPVGSIVLSQRQILLRDKRTLDATGVSWLGVRPGYRSAELMMRLFERAFRESRELRHPVSTMYPFRENAYGFVDYHPCTEYRSLYFEALQPLTRKEHPWDTAPIDDPRFRAQLAPESHPAPGSSNRVKDYVEEFADQSLLTHGPTPVIITPRQSGPARSHRSFAICQERLSLSGAPYLRVLHKQVENSSDYAAVLQGLAHVAKGRRVLFDRISTDDPLLHLVSLRELIEQRTHAGLYLKILDVGAVLDGMFGDRCQCPKSSARVTCIFGVVCTGV